MADETQDASFGRWRNLSTAVLANAADLPDLVGPARRLAGMLNQAEGAVTEQAVLTASKQRVSQNLQGIVTKGRKLATFVAVGLREHYGRGSEKLAEFRIQPIRGKRQPVVEPPPVSEVSLPETETDPQP